MVSDNIRSIWVIGTRYHLLGIQRSYCDKHLAMTKIDITATSKLVGL